MTDEAWRPRLHFAPPGWMNDPNGLVRVGEAWRLYFQYSALDEDVGRVQWGTASSEGLLHWTFDGIAVRADAPTSAYSGSVCLVPGHASDLFAFYTANHTPADGGRRQAQHRARSRDGGRSFTPHPDVPVLDEGLSNFRDPFVCRRGNAHAMLVAKPDDWNASDTWAGSTIAVYASSDLLTWDWQGRIGPWDAPGVLWEVPWLLEHTGADGATVWLLAVSTVDRRESVTRCATRHWFGHFDGCTFAPFELQPGLPLDFGPDYYAPIVSTRMAPDEEPLSVAWIGNGAYARRLPVTPWAGGVLALPRVLSLVERQGGWRLRQRPTPGVDALRVAPGTRVDTVVAPALVQAIALPDLP